MSMPWCLMEWAASQWLASTSSLGTASSETCNPNHNTLTFLHSFAHAVRGCHKHTDSTRQPTPRARSRQRQSSDHADPRVRDVQGAEAHGAAHLRRRRLRRQQSPESGPGCDHPGAVGAEHDGEVNTGRDGEVLPREWGEPLGEMRAFEGYGTFPSTPGSSCAGLYVLTI